MRTEWLIYLDDISKTHSITQTAQRFFISQQALSFSIKKLEEEFGTTLLNRTNHGATLTPEGTAFLKKARHMIDLYYDLKEEFELPTLSETEDDMIPTGKIKILTHTRLLEALLIDLIEKYGRRAPSVQLILQEKENVAILQAIDEGQADLGLIFVPDPFLNELISTDTPNLKFQRLFSDDFIACCNRNHPFAQEKSLKFEDIANVPTLVFDTNPKILSSGQEMDVAATTGSLFFSCNESFHKEMLRRGLAVSVITLFEFRKIFLKYKDLTAIPIDNSFKSNIVLVTSTRKKPDPAAVLFEKMLLSYDFYGV